MNAQKTKQMLYHEVPLQILSYISVHHGAVLSADEIREGVNASKGATNQTLRLLVNLDIVSREKKGNLFLYRLNPGSVLLKQFKIFENVLMLHDLVREIEKYCYEIILFGSCATGANAKDSDIDLFIRTEHKEEVTKALHKDELNGKIKAIIQDSLELASFKNEDTVLYNQIIKGITLWRGKPPDEEI